MKRNITHSKVKSSLNSYWDCFYFCIFSLLQFFYDFNFKHICDICKLTIKLNDQICEIKKPHFHSFVLWNDRIVRLWLDILQNRECWIASENEMSKKAQYLNYIVRTYKTKSCFRESMLYVYNYTNSRSKHVAK